MCFLHHSRMTIYGFQINCPVGTRPVPRAPNESGNQPLCVKPADSSYSLDSFGARGYGSKLVKRKKRMDTQCDSFGAWGLGSKYLDP